MRKIYIYILHIYEYIYIYIYIYIYYACLHVTGINKYIYPSEGGSRGNIES